MTRLPEIALATLACLSLAGCDLLEGIHQTSPTYRRPVPFSTPWWEAMEIRKKKREIAHIETDWAVHKPKKPFIYQP